MRRWQASGGKSLLFLEKKKQKNFFRLGAAWVTGLGAVVGEFIGFAGFRRACSARGRSHGYPFCLQTRTSQVAERQESSFFGKKEAKNFIRLGAAWVMGLGAVAGEFVGFAGFSRACPARGRSHGYAFCLQTRTSQVAERQESSFLKKKKQKNFIRLKTA